jgi:DNA-binding Xre family transcriptional regulator
MVGRYVSIHAQTLIVNDFSILAYRVEGMRLDDDIRAAFGRRLREIRTQKELSQEKLAAQAGLARNFVSMVETGQRNVTISTVQKLAKGLDCRMADLMPDAEDD